MPVLGRPPEVVVDIGVGGGPRGHRGAATSGSGGRRSREGDIRNRGWGRLSRGGRHRIGGGRRSGGRPARGDGPGHVGGRAEPGADKAEPSKERRGAQSASKPCWEVQADL